MKLRRKFKVGKRKFSLKEMHSARGTETFQHLKPSDQKRWARWDSRHSRGMWLGKI